MSLATRCTACGTIFRVVQDQLRVSEGWVRCGRCDAVFLATESLFDLDLDAPPPWSATELPPLPASTPPAQPATGAAAQYAAPEPDSPDAPTSAEATLRALSAAAAASQANALETQADADAIVVAAERPVPPATAEPVRALGAAPAPTEAAPPAFIEQARREAFWQRRRVRALLGVAALALVTLLALQATRQFSDIAAARWPALRPVLAPWCQATGCSLAAPRRIDAIVVDSTALTPAPGTGALQLSISLRNRAAHAVALPAVDLSLTDPAGRLISRRTLLPRDFRVDAADLAGRAELPLRLLLGTGDEHVSGYTVEVFYP